MFNAGKPKLGNAALRSSLTAAVVGLTISTASAVRASSLVFDQSPVTDAVAQIDKLFHVTVEIKPGVDADGYVTFTVSDIGKPGSRLQAINALATSLNADYQKIFVVSQIADDSEAADPVLDIDAPVVFSDSDQTAEEAIELVAAIDDARVQFYTPVHGSISLPDKQLSAPDAAGELARQTHTRWKAYYAIIPRRHGLVANGSRVIGYTDGGQPITEMAMQSFRMPRVPKAEPNSSLKDDATGENTNQPATQNGKDQQAASNPDAEYNWLANNGYGGGPTGYSQFPLAGNPYYFGSGQSSAPYTNAPGLVYVPNAMTMVNGQLMLQPPSTAPDYGTPIVIH